MFFAFSGLPDTDYCDDDADNRHGNTGKFQNHFEITIEKPYKTERFL